MLYQCCNCDWETNELEDVCPELPDLWERMEAGDVYPQGTCPECRCFVHRVDETFVAMACGQELLAACQMLVDAQGKGLAFLTEETSVVIERAVARATNLDRDDPLVTRKHHTLTIEVEGGVVQGVLGLPDGWSYEIHDYDDDLDDVPMLTEHGPFCRADDTQGPTL